MRNVVCALVGLLLAVSCASPIHRYPRAVLPNSIEPLPVDIDQTHLIDIDEERVALTKEYFAVHNSALAAALPAENNVESIRFEPKVVVVHYTAIPTLQGTLDIFGPKFIGGDRKIVAANGRLNVGIQFVVDLDGKIYASYPDNVMSRHVIGLNHVAIGIENIGNADLGKNRRGKTPVTMAQLDANEALIRYLVNKYPSIKFVIAHYEYTDLEDPRHPAHSLFVEDVAGYRTEKVDPGKRFMKALRKRLGIQ